MMTRSLGLVLAGLLLTTSFLYAQSTDDQVTAVFVEEAPRIDGILDDSVWQVITPITAFTQVWPHEGEPATEYSEVRVAYNRNYLFFGFTFHDREPHLIRAKNLERGGRNDRDDHVYIALDTYLDKRNAYLFEVNALGTQGEATITNEALLLDSFSWDAVFRSETVIDDQGWTLEVAIPFRQLRFPKGDDLSFGLMLSRTINRKNERVTWPEIGLEYGGSVGVLAAVSQYGTVTGLKNVRRGRNIEIKPYVTTGAFSNPSDGYDESFSLKHEFRRDFGVDFKYGFASNLTLDLTVNTDFYQVESDNVQINLTRFNLFYPEKREFFLERGGLFEHGNPRTTQTFFSRGLGLFSRILTGARLTGQLGPLSIGLMNVETGDNLSKTFGGGTDNSTVARVRATVFPRATVGAIATHWVGGENKFFDFRGDRNTALGADAQIRFWSSSELAGWYTFTNHIDRYEYGRHVFYDSLRSSAGHASLRLLNDTYGTSVSYTSIGRDYYPALGFVRREDQRRINGTAQYTPVISSTLLPAVRRLTFGGEYTHIRDQDGKLESTRQEVVFGAEFMRRDGIMVGLTRRFERLEYPFWIRTGAVVREGDYNYTQVSLSGETDSSRRLYGGGILSTGGFFSGTETRFEGDLGFRANQHLNLEVQIGHSIIDLPSDSDGDRFNATTMSLSVLGALSRKLFATALVQYDNFSGDVQTNIRINWIHTPGSDLFLVFNTLHSFFKGADWYFETEYRGARLIERAALAKLTYLILL